MISCNFLEKFWFGTETVNYFRVSSHGRPKAGRQTKKFNMWNDRKVGPDIEGLSNNQFAEIGYASRKVQVTKGK